MKKNYLLELKSRLEKIRIPAKLIFIVMGIASTLWFVFRVIPKPSRAAYPCMRAAAPFMSSFIIYVLALGTTVFAFRKAKQKLIEAKYLLAGVLLLGSVISAAVFLIQDVRESKAATLPDAPNTPMGDAQGIKPGRVTWAWCREAVCQGMESKVAKYLNNKGGNIGSDYDSLRDRVYYNPRFMYQPAIDSMVKMSVLALANQSDLATAWDTIFRYFNKKKTGTPAGYKKTEKIFIKINLTGGSTGPAPIGQYWGRLHPDLTRVNPSWQANPDLVETNPFTVLAIIRQLVNVAGVPDSMIYVGDPMKNVYNDMFYYWKKEFPKLNVLQSKIQSGITATGRLKVVTGSTDRYYYSDGSGLKDKIYTVQEEADYLINMSVLKAHNRNGITLCAKNMFGSQSRNDASHLHGSLIAPDEKTQTNATYSKYRILVDLMGNKYAGGNTLVFIVDGLVCAEKDWEGPAIRLKMAPFNNEYPASIFMSLDDVALESVCFDFLRTEFDPTNGHATNSPFNYGAVDDYLHQAADTNNWPAGIKYKPNGDGKTIASLGTHEHWNNAIDKQYSRNLDAINGKGIELFKITFSMPHTWDTAAPVDDTTTRVAPAMISSLKTYPNPASSLVEIGYEIASNAAVTIEIYNIKGQKVATIVNQNQAAGTYSAQWNSESAAEGMYVCKLLVNGAKGAMMESKRIQIIR